ncbi:dTDP-4-amino-4,6-dideoxygalactose transaminase [Pseudobdellovibrio exovorus]|nr:dTDP-4-amino-4,6-dideoxygalactose transaminase [Pseudobdellovibrio exovorus]
MTIPFNIPPHSENALKYIENSFRGSKLSGDGDYNKKCVHWLNNYFKSKLSVVTPSCTSALEMSMLLADIGPGDEVILPSYTFSSTANAVVIFGAIPVFVDIEPDTMNISPAEIKKAITPKTKMIMPVHYAGVGCKMDEIMAIAQEHSLIVVEDAAQGMLASYKNKPLGAIGHMSAVSFHDTKNIVCGEGGCLVINDDKFLARAEIIRDKGTNRQKFLNGQVDKYTWVDKGSSYLISEVTAAFLLAQLEDSQQITLPRLSAWATYHNGLKQIEEKGHLKRMSIPKECLGNAHIYYILLNSQDDRNKLAQFLKNEGIMTTSHYVPLHSAPAGRSFGRFVGDMNITDDLSNRLLRLPMHSHLKNEDTLTVVNKINLFFQN